MYGIATLVLYLKHYQGRGWACTQREGLDLHMPTTALYNNIFDFHGSLGGTRLLVSYVVTAVGVAHQAVEEISPEGDSVLIMGMWTSTVITIIIFTMNIRVWPNWSAFSRYCKSNGS